MSLCTIIYHVQKIIRYYTLWCKITYQVVSVVHFQRKEEIEIPEKKSYTL